MGKYGGGVRPHPLVDDELVFDGKTYFVARNVNLGGLGGLNLDARLIRQSNADPQGGVHLVNKLWFCTASSPETTNSNDVVNLNFINAQTGGTVRETLPILCPSHNLGASPLSATDHVSFVWEPSAAIMVPKGWRVETDWNTPITLESTPFSVLATGLRLDEHEARRMGFDVSTDALQADRRWIQRGIAPTTDTTTSLVPARSKQCIFISDILLVMSPAAANATVELETSDGRNIFRWVTGAVTGVPIVRAIKCRIFVDQSGVGSPISSGYGLQVTSTNCAGRFSIIVLGRYVDLDQVPNNAWWANVTPASPTASLGPTLARTVKTSAGVNRELVVEGMELSMARDGSSPLSNIVFALTYGTAAGTGSNFTLDGNVLISPIFSMFGRDELLATGIDEVQIEAATGADIFFESMGGAGGIGTPTTGDLVDASCTVWGRHQERRRSSASIERFEGA